MKVTLEELWEEYLSEKCAALDTDEERKFMKETVELHTKANALLNQDQQDAVEKYVDALCEVETHFEKKAFLMGCKFAVSFLLEARCLGK